MKWIVTAFASLLLSSCSEDAPARIPGPACPDRMVHLPAVGACVDRYEAALEGEDPATVAVPAEDRLPADGLSWFQADRACRNAGYRLCTAEEWHYACAGVEGVVGGRALPYGDTEETEACNSMPDGAPVPSPELAPGGSHDRCASPEGVFDLSGNVVEWLATADPTGTLRELRGGSYGSFARESRCVRAPPMYNPPESLVPGRGFRCCADARGAIREAHGSSTAVKASPPPPLPSAG